MNRSLAFLFPLFLCVPAFTQNMSKSDMPMSDMKNMSATSPASAGYMAAMNKMDKAMTMKYTNDADADFLRGMIPHHQGAVDMCKVELQYGKDPQIHKLCNGIIASQESQIVQMKKWLQQREK